MYQGIGGYLDCSETNSASSCNMLMNTPMGQKETTYDVISTDYENYAVYYMCKNMFASNMRMEWLNIMGRDFTLPESKMAEIKRDISKQLPEFDLSENSMHKTKQGESCDYDFTM